MIKTIVITPFLGKSHLFKTNRFLDGEVVYSPNHQLEEKCIGYSFNDFLGKGKSVLIKDFDFYDPEFALAYSNTSLIYNKLYREVFNDYDDILCIRPFDYSLQSNVTVITATKATYLELLKQGNKDNYHWLLDLYNKNRDLCETHIDTFISQALNYSNKHFITEQIGENNKQFMSIIEGVVYD